jgi:hypothetical protein
LGLTVGGGAVGERFQNENGVILDLIGAQLGLEASLGSAGMPDERNGGGGVAIEGPRLEGIADRAKDRAALAMAGVENAAQHLVAIAEDGVGLVDQECWSMSVDDPEDR